MRENLAMLDAVLRERIEGLLGVRLTGCDPADGGYTPALRLRCGTGQRTCFVKVGAAPLTDAFVAREIDTYLKLETLFMPRLIAWSSPGADAAAPGPVSVPGIPATALPWALRALDLPPVAWALA